VNRNIAVAMVDDFDDGAVALLISLVLFFSVSLLTSRPIASQIDAATTVNKKEYS
jgi:hypothetical protein